MVKNQNECFLSTQEMLANKGYHTVTPTIGSFGKALMQASKENPENKVVKHQLDVMFTKLRREKKKNGRNK